MFAQQQLQKPGVVGHHPRVLSGGLHACFPEIVSTTVTGWSRVAILFGDIGPLKGQDSLV